MHSSRGQVFGRSSGRTRRSSTRTRASRPVRPGPGSGWCRCRRRPPASRPPRPGGAGRCRWRGRRRPPRHSAASLGSEVRPQRSSASIGPSAAFRASTSGRSSGAPTRTSPRPLEHDRTRATSANCSGGHRLVSHRAPTLTARHGPGDRPGGSTEPRRRRRRRAGDPEPWPRHVGPEGLGGPSRSRSTACDSGPGEPTRWCRSTSTPRGLRPGPPGPGRRWPGP